MLYNRTNNILEIFLKNKANLHNIEDYLREKLFYKNEYLSHVETIFLARILYGRLINSNGIDKKLDARHSKAQIITVTCLAFYLYKNNSLLKKNIETELYNLLEFHVILIDEYVSTYFVNSTNNVKNNSNSTMPGLEVMKEQMTYDDYINKFQYKNSLESEKFKKTNESIISSFKNDNNYYNYCKDLNLVCKLIILHNKLNLYNNNEIIKHQDKIIVYINPSIIDYIKLKNSNLKKYISNLNLSDFYIKYEDDFNIGSDFNTIYSYLESYVPNYQIIQNKIYHDNFVKNSLNNY